MNKQLLAILTADIHLRETQPQCRKDNYFNAQENAIKFLEKIKDDTYILDAGDLFHNSKAFNYLNAWTIKNLPNNFITVPGNHDLIDHNIKLLNKTNLNVLSAAKDIIILNYNYKKIDSNVVVYGIPYCTKLPDLVIKNDFKDFFKILIIHTMVFENLKSKNKYIEGFSAKQLLKHFKEFDLILSGHNHKTFVVEYEGRKVVNPGSLMLMTADQKEHKPCVFKLYNDFSIEKIFIPQNKMVFDDSYLENKKEKDNRIQNFVDNVKVDKKISIDFIQNVENYLIKNKVKRSIQKIIWENVK